jgi:hypothetical protein
MSIGSIGEGHDGRKRYADTKATAAYMRVSTALLEKSRVTGSPKIPFIKVGRSVRYDLDIIDGLMAEWSRLSTSEKGAA